MESRNIVTRNLNENYTVCCVTLHKRSDDVVLLEKKFFFSSLSMRKKILRSKFYGPFMLAYAWSCSVVKV